MVYLECASLRASDYLAGSKAQGQMVPAYSAYLDGARVALEQVWERPSVCPRCDQVTRARPSEGLVVFPCLRQKAPQNDTKGPSWDRPRVRRWVGVARMCSSRRAQEPEPG